MSVCCANEARYSVISLYCLTNYIINNQSPVERNVDVSILGQFWGAGGTVVVHLSLTTVTRVRFRLRAVI